MGSAQWPPMNVTAILVDMGTTTTRVWLVAGERVLAKANAAVGVRDTARDGSPQRIKTALRDLIQEICRNESEPEFVAAAGMITSPLGLCHIPHVPAPAGLRELASASQWRKFEDVTNLRVLLIPGVSSGPAKPGLDTIFEKDIMRGEETLCIGLGAASTTVLSLGSHWKAIRIDADGRIASSFTSLSGEIIHAAQTQTILASSVSQERPTTISDRWIEAGMKEQRRSGLARAFFCVRLLDLSGQGTAEERLSFLIGAVIASDLDALVARGMLSGATPVITGNTVIGQAWRTALAGIGISSVDVLTAEETERVLIAGFRSILAYSTPC